MAMVLFDNTTRTGPGNVSVETPVFEIDLTLNHNHARSVELTSSPVETGVDVNDHVIRRPLVYSFAGLLVNEPYDPQVAQARSAAAGVTNPGFIERGIQALEQAVAGGFEDPLRASRLKGPQVSETRAREQLQILIDLFETSRVVEVVANDEISGNMVLTDLRHAPRGRGAIEVSGTFRTVLFATTQQIDLPVPSSSVPSSEVAARSKPEVDQGTKGTKEADSVKASSLASKLLDFAGAAF